MEFDFDIDHEISEHPFDPMQRDTEPTANPKPKRGRPALPELWTRVISVSHDNLAALKTYELRSDLLLAKGLPSSILGNITG